MFKLNLKIAIRNLWRNKGYALINVGGLAIGLASCLMLMLYVNYEWSYNRQIKDVDKIYQAKLNLLFNGKLATTSAVPNALAGAVLQEIPGVMMASRMADRPEAKLISRNQQKFKISTSYVDGNFLKLLGYKVLAGNGELALSNPNAVVLTEETAKKLFGSEDPIGKSLRWDNRKDLKVTAVIEDLPKNQSIQFGALIPWSFYLQIHPEEKNPGWGSISCVTLFRLKDNANLETINASLKKFIVSKEPELKSYVFEPFLFPLTAVHLYDEFENGKSIGGKIDEVRLFGFLALCVLLIACINYMNLSTARSEKRAREVGVRKALGSGRGSLMSQFMLESLMLSLLAMIIAFALLEISLPYFNNLLNIVIQINYSSPLFWLALLTLILITGLLAGSYPAFYLSSFVPVKVLKGFKGSVGSLSVRRVLVVFQFTLSICMIISAIFIYNQMQFMKNKSLGFNEENLVQLDLEGEMKNPSKLALFKETLKREGAIVAATEFSTPFTQGGSITGNVSWPGKSPTDKSIINYRSIGFEFAATLGVNMVAGRDFSPKFPADTSTSVLLNETAVKLMSLKNPVGTILTWDGNPPLTVVGVVKDYFSVSLSKAPQPTIYYYSLKESKVLLLRLNPAQQLTKSIAAIKALGEKHNPAYPVELSYISTGMEEKLQSERLLSVLSNFFGGFAIIISCLGLLGLALYMAEQRNKEISIRKVLGANLQDILVLLNKDFLKLVVVSNIIAMPIAYVLVTKWLEKYDYKTEINYLPFLMAIVASIFIAVLTVSLQTFKVAKANAVDALKYE